MTQNNYSYEEFPDAQEIRYSIITGKRGLIVVDSDSQVFTQSLMASPVFVNTFRVLSPSGGVHFYFRMIDGSEPRTRRYDENDVRITDILGLGSHVLGPNSKIGDKEYKIINDVEIMKIGYNELLDKIFECYPNLEEVEKKSQRIERIKAKVEKDISISYIKSKLTISNVLEDAGIISVLGTNTNCPFHESKSGKCFSFGKHWFNCFHCLKSGSIIDLYAEMNSLSFSEAKHSLSKRVGVPPEIVQKSIELAQQQGTLNRNIAIEEYAAEFKKINHVVSTKKDKNQEVWIYDKGVYVPNGKIVIHSYCRTVMNLHYSKLFADKVVDKIIVDTLIDSEDFFDKASASENPETDWLAVQNGILNVRTRELKVESPEYVFFSKINAVYDKDAVPGKFLKFISEILKPEDVILMQEICGYALTRSNGMKKAFMFIGAGNNGKSAFMSFMRNFLGPTNVSSVSLSQMANNNYVASKLFGKLANINGDLDTNDVLDTSLFKQLTGGDLITADRKYKDALDFVNRAKLIFLTNQLPMTLDYSDGFFSRWIIVDFPYVFGDVEDRERGIKKANKGIVEELCTREEFSGFLNWCLEGLDRLMQNEAFSNSKTMDELKDQWLRKSDSGYAFVQDCIEVTYKEGDYIKYSELRTKYMLYCKKYGLAPQTESQMKNSLGRCKLVPDRKRVAFGGATPVVKVYINCKFKVEIKEEVEEK